jgi:hypothetical protein
LAGLVDPLNPFTKKGYVYEEPTEETDLAARAARWIPASSVLPQLSVPSPTTITVEDIRRYRGPTVYVVRKEGTVLYVGQSTDVFQRLMMARHPAREAIDASTGIDLYRCDSIAHAKTLETKLLLRHRPKFNFQRNRCTVINGIDCREYREL